MIEIKVKNCEFRKWINNGVLQYTINKVRTDYYKKWDEFYLIKFWGDLRIKDIKVTTSIDTFHGHHIYCKDLGEALEVVKEVFRFLKYKKKFYTNQIVVKDVVYKNDVYNIVSYKGKEIYVNNIQVFSIKRMIEEMLKNKLKGTGFKVGAGDKKVFVNYEKGFYKIVVKTPYSEEWFKYVYKFDISNLSDEDIELIALGVEIVAAEIYNATVNKTVALRKNYNF